jgi:hypothetical protein
MIFEFQERNYIKLRIINIKHINIEKNESKSLVEIGGVYHKRSQGAKYNARKNDNLN